MYTVHVLAHAEHGYSAHAHALHTHIMHTHVMHAHAVHATAVHRMFHMWINNLYTYQTDLLRIISDLSIQ
jgi:hypothetical protein